MSIAICFLGFGEAAQTFAGAPGWRGRTRGYDIQTDSPHLAAAKRSDFARFGVAAAETTAAAATDTRIVLSLVTADQSLAAARNAAPHLSPDTLYLDMNSVAPSTKQAAASVIDETGAHYVDVAIMSPVRPAALATPLLVSGMRAEAATTALRELGFTSVTVAGEQVGRASLVKMVRSVLIKGVEAVSAECLLAAQAANVLDDVLSSLGGDWPERLNYNLDRVLAHGQRRASELEEVRRTLIDLGIAPTMTAGAIVRQRELGALQIGAIPATLAAKLDTIEKASNV
jgi:3-hydroxyisobutyrate dehydrogenase-like beta-hydroxyacid dehydrogenase